MGTHLRALSESPLMNTNILQGLNGFQKSLCPCACSLSIERVKVHQEENSSVDGAVLDLVAYIPLVDP